ncbi:MAG: hypothetical protein QOE54_7347 [Streptosporangiaceae bacterium]|jgi:hypothetical protein|nr:hypothetical protein [Streptosporangiaceae bacterium]
MVTGLPVYGRKLINAFLFGFSFTVDGSYIEC